MESKNQPQISPSTKTAGLLLKAFREGKTEEIRWVPLEVDGLVLSVASDAMKAPLGDRPGVRLPVSYLETIEINAALDCVAPTQAMCDAMFSKAKSQLTLVALVRAASDAVKLTWVDFALRFHEGVEKQLAALHQNDPGLIAGAWKYWILHPRLVERGAVNYGFWDKSRKPPRPVQTVGGQHDARHYDYSQLLQPIKRIARRAATGEDVDLLDYIQAHDRVPQRFLDVYRPHAPQARSFMNLEPVPATSVDALRMLSAAGVNIEEAEGWESRGRAGFTPQGIMVHHTAGPKTGDAPSLSLCIHGRPDLSGPLCHIVLGRSGKAHLIAANIANHAGKGAAQVLDLVAKDEPVVGNAREHGFADVVSGNQFFYGIEVENSGQAGDPYPAEQIEALAQICSILCHAHGWSATRVVHHRQWTSRKIDMSWRGDLPAMVAQCMDAPTMAFAVGEDPTPPMWEQEGADATSTRCGEDDS